MVFQVGIEMGIGNAKYPVLISTAAVPEMHQVRVSEDAVLFGASLNLEALSGHLGDAIASVSGDHRARIWRAVKEQLHWFASTPIRNAACLGGNLATASPISDVNPLLMASNTKVRWHTPLAC